MLRQGRSNRAALGQGSLFLLKEYIQCRTISLSSSVGTKEKAMATHSSTLAWKIPWMEEPGRLQSMGSLELDTTERLHFHFSLSCLGEGNGNPLQCSCLENPRDRGAWWAAIDGVAQSRTRLKRLSSSSMSDSCEPMDCSLPGSSVHGILQAIILEWVAISIFRGSSQPRNQTQVS